MSKRMRIVITALAATLVACASSTRGAKSWEQVKRDRLEAYENVAVISLNEDSRESWEDATVEILRGKKIRATSSYTFLPELADIGQPAFVDRVRADGFEGIVTVRITSAEDDERLAVTPDSIVRDVVVIQASADRTEGDFRLEIVLFDCREDYYREWNPVWAGRSQIIAADVAPADVGRYVVGVLKEQSLF